MGKGGVFAARRSGVLAGHGCDMPRTHNDEEIRR